MVTRELTRKRAWAAWTAAQTADRQIERQPRAQAQNDQPRSKAKRRPRRAHSEQMREEAVPSTPLQRVVGFGSLAVQMAFGAASEQVSRTIGSKEASDSVWLNDANAQLLSQTLCRMRGSALKLGQMLSIQDDVALSPQLASALERVRQGADRMPDSQLFSVMERELGAAWEKELPHFDPIPLAAASIGQVHAANVPGVGEVAVKVQYPGVAESINSDVDNLSRLVRYTGAFPRGLFIERIMKVMKEELEEECDYANEASHQKAFRKLLADDPTFVVPQVVERLSTSRVLTMTLEEGVPIDRVADMPQQTRNSVARRVLRLVLRELFEFGRMQTDPSFANFLYDQDTDRIVLLDFGAARTYDDAFLDEYLNLVWAASNGDEDAVLASSIKLGFLTGEESSEMIAAHLEAGLKVGEPFADRSVYDFSNSDMSKSLSKHGAVFLRDRLTPPPREIYSLHRKLSGAFMLCVRIGAKIPCRDLLEYTRAQRLRSRPRPS